MEEHLDNLSFSFFKLYAQYESFLKDNGYFVPLNNGTIIVDWDRFVNEKIGNEFITKLGNKAESANYILTSPPKKQAVNNNKIVWQQVANDEKSVQVLFGHMSRIRNNLFHGAKFHGTYFDPKRSEQLLQHGLVILEHFKELVNIR